MKYELPKLPYAYSALEPHIDAKTMEIHHSKHHQAYVDKLNAIMEKYPDLQNMPVNELIASLNTLNVSDDDRQGIRNHGGGHANHSFFWTLMGPEKETDDALIKKISDQFTSLERFKEDFSEKALGHFGSGWAWLVETSSGSLEIIALPNQDSPLTLGKEPILTIDLWEHAYYLKYQNRRKEYIANWWNTVRCI